MGWAVEGKGDQFAFTSEQCKNSDVFAIPIFKWPFINLFVRGPWLIKTLVSMNILFCRLVRRLIVYSLYLSFSP